MGIDELTYKSLMEEVINIRRHLHKYPEISEKELINFQNCGIDDYRIFKEPSNYRTLGLFATFDNNVIIGSDIQDWDKYEESNFSELKLSVDSFEQFLLLSKKFVDSFSHCKLAISSFPHFL